MPRACKNNQQSTAQHSPHHQHVIPSSSSSHKVTVEPVDSCCRSRCRLWCLQSSTTTRSCARRLAQHTPRPVTVSIVCGMASADAQAMAAELRSLVSAAQQSAVAKAAPYKPTQVLLRRHAELAPISTCFHNRN